jgi:hypothetical protein
MSAWKCSDRRIGQFREMAEAGWPADSEEARIIVAFRNLGSPAFSNIYHANGSGSV